MDHVTGARPAQSHLTQGAPPTEAQPESLQCPGHHPVCSPGLLMLFCPGASSRDQSPSSPARRTKNPKLLRCVPCAGKEARPSLSTEADSQEVTWGVMFSWWQMLAGWPQIEVLSELWERLVIKIRPWGIVNVIPQKEPELACGTRSSHPRKGAWRQRGNERPP